MNPYETLYSSANGNFTTISKDDKQNKSELKKPLF